MAWCGDPGPLVNMFPDNILKPRPHCNLQSSAWIIYYQEPCIDYKIYWLLLSYKQKYFAFFSYKYFYVK